MNSESTKKMKLKEIEVDERIYPRKRTDSKNVDQLVEKLKAGKELKPVEVQKVKDDGKRRVLVTNGKHRKLAYMKFNELEDYENIEEVPIKFWKGKVPIDFEEHMDEMLIHAHQVNDDQGLNVRKEDTRHTARKLRRRNSSWTAKKISKELNRARSTIQGYIKDIVQKQQATERQLIGNLELMGYKQVEIAKEIVGKTEARVSQILNNVDSSKIKDFYENNKSVEDIAELFDLSVPATWNFILEGKDDLDRFKKFGKSDHGDAEPQTTDKWEFPHPDPRIGNEYPGRLYGQVVLNILYYHTKQGDLIVDPFAGGGSTIDACLIMDRECRAYDIKPSRKDILENDIRDGYPKEARGTDMTILDPPYGDKMEDEYGSNGFTGDRDTIMKNVDQLAEDSYEIGCKVAFIYGNHKDRKGKGDIWAPQLHHLFEDKGFETEFIYQVPSKGYPSPHGQIQQRTRDLYIFCK